MFTVKFINLKVVFNVHEAVSIKQKIFEINQPTQNATNQNAISNSGK